MIRKSLLDHLTPVPVLQLPEEGGTADIYVALLHMLPGESHKILGATSMIADAEDQHEIYDDTIFFDKSSGNYASAAALVCAVKGYRFKCFMPEGMAPEKVRQITACGGKIHWTPAKEFVDGAEIRAIEFYKKNPENKIYLDQANNPANPRGYAPVGQQFIDELPAIDALVSGGGTYGTITGIASVLKAHDKHIKVVCVESEDTPRLDAMRRGYKMPAFTGQSVTGFGGRKMPGNARPELYDKIFLIDKTRTLAHLREIHSQGLLVGASSAAVLYAAREVARELGEGHTVVTHTYDSLSKMPVDAMY